VAGAFGTAVLISVATLGSHDTTAVSPDGSGLRAAFIGAGIIGLLAFAGSWLIRRGPAAPATSEH
jgi:DHA2 family lincomycin resistance protein-like MFS transporter